MDGHQYEYVCAKILRDRGFSRVTVTKGSGDQGIDVIAYDGDKKYGIQCKYYSSPVGNHAVQEACAGAIYYNCDVAVVMTNNTFTSAAKELAEKTGVILWDNNKVPQSSSSPIHHRKSFLITKFIGIFTFIIGILGLVTIRGFDDIKFPILQSIELAFLIFGGIFAIFEHKNWGMAFFSFMFYFIDVIINLIFNVLTMKLPSFDFFIFSGIASILFLRMDYLHKSINGYHVWENGFRKFINDNFSKDNWKKKLIIGKDNKLKELNAELSEAIKKYGNIYVNFFNEYYYVNSSLINARDTGNGTIEFIIKCETLEQAQYIIMHEDQLNQKLDHNHKMILLGNSCISLTVTKK